MKIPSFGGEYCSGGSKRILCGLHENLQVPQFRDLEKEPHVEDESGRLLEIRACMKLRAVA